MCLGVPSKIEKVYQEDGLLMGLLDFNGVKRETCLTAIPDAAVGEFVMVHAGFAISRINAADAAETQAILDEIDRLNDSF